LHDLSQTIDRLRLDRGRLDASTALAELETAREELRVADEEIHAQQEELSRLLRSQQCQQLFEERVISALPAAVLITSSAGIILSANAAVGALFGVPVLHLQGKPLQAYVAQSDRSELRRALSGVGDELEAGISLRVRLRPRRKAELPVRLIAHPRTDDRSDVVDVVWVVPADQAEERGALAVADAFSRLVRLPLGAAEGTTLLGRMARVCADSLGGDVSVTVTLGSPIAPKAVGSTDSLAQAADGAMVLAGQGPCLDAWEQRIVVRCEQLGTDARWPRFAAAARHMDVGGAVAIPLDDKQGLQGVLTLYASVPGRFDQETIEIARFLGMSVAAVLREVEQRNEIAALADNLSKALETRPVIEQAKGILMVTYRCTDEEAFARLVRLSRGSNVKLRVVAERIVEGVSTGDPHSLLN
jgi:PAS domain-containing protein